MKYSIVYVFILLVGCNTIKIPKKRLNQYTLDYQYEFKVDRLEVYLSNPLKCPVRIWVQPADAKLRAVFDAMNPVILKPLADSVISVETHNVLTREIGFASRLGDPNRPLKVRQVELPFPENRAYPLVQGYNSTPTHNTDWSKYALDFGLAIGDTICAATPGYVVGLIEDYKYGGEGDEWKNYGNFITIYDETTGLYTQYAHLYHKGSLVNMGDKIEVGQKIGIAGMTGQTNIEHLHFNCLKPVNSEDGLISIPIDSIGQHRISDLKRNEMVSH